MGIPIPKTVVIWVFPSHITFAIWVRVKVRVTGDVHSTWGKGMPKVRGFPYHCDTGTFETRVPLDNVPVFNIRAEDNINGFRLFSLCIYSLLLASH